MLTNIHDKFAWRYHAYASPLLESIGGIKYQAQKIANNIDCRRKSNVLAYIYATPGNAGDYLSMCGVRLLAGQPGYIFQCDSRSLKSTARALNSHGNIRALLIGGGGLLQPVFTPFWDQVLKQDIPYSLFGVGVNLLPPERPMVDQTRLELIGKNAIGIHVRENESRKLLQEATGRDDITVGICPSVNYLHQFRVNQPKRDRILLHVVHPADLRMKGVSVSELVSKVKDCASSLGLEYRETSNTRGWSRSQLSEYLRSSIVISSRLHGCIIASALGIPFLPIVADEKTRWYLTTHAPHLPMFFSDTVFENLDTEVIKSAISSEKTNRMSVLKQIRNNEVAMADLLKNTSDPNV